MPVNILVTAQTNAAAAELVAFAARAGLSLKKVEQAAIVSGNALLKNNKALKSAIGGLALNASLFAGPDAQRFLYPLVLMQKELKGLASAAKLTTIGLGGISAATLGVTAAVVTGVAWWQKYKAELQAAAAQQANFDSQRLRAKKEDELLDANVALDRLPGGEGAALKARLRAATPEGFRMEKETRKKLVPLDEGLLGPDGSKTMEVDDPVEKRIATERLADVEKIVKARLKEVQLTEEQIKQVVELQDKTRQLNIELLDGFAKERAAEEERYQQAKLAANKVDIFGKAPDQIAIQEAFQVNDLLHAKTMADLDKKEWDEKVKRALELQEIEDKAKLEEYAAWRKFNEEQKHAELEKIQNSPFLTDADKYRQTRAAGGDVSGTANPDSLPEQMTAAWVQMQNQIGTIQQQIAQSWVEVMGAAIDSTTQSIVGLIEGTMSLSDAFRNIGKTILDTVIKNIVKMGVQFVATELLMTAAKITGSQVRSTAEKKEGLQTAFTAATKAAKAVADVPYIGWALAVAAFTGTLALMTAASALGGFRAGGYTGAGGADEIAGFAHRGEYVMPASTVQRLGVDAMAQIHHGTGGTGGGGGNTTIHAFFDRQQLFQASRDNVEAIVVSFLDRNRARLGFPT